MAKNKKVAVISSEKKQLIYTGIVLVIIWIMTVAVAEFLTNAKEVEEVTSNQVIEEEPVVYQSMETNPLRVNKDEKIQEAVEAYYQNLTEQEDYAEAYNGLTIYYKQGKKKESRILYIEYAMKIQGIYTEVPGLGTLYAEPDKTGDVQLYPEVEDEETKKVIEEVSTQEDVQELFTKVENTYEEAVQSDVMLSQALEDLKNAADQ